MSSKIKHESACPLCKENSYKLIYNQVRSSGNLTEYDLGQNLKNLDIVLCRFCGFLYRKELWTDNEQKDYFTNEYKQVYKKKLIKNPHLYKKITQRKYMENIQYVKKYIKKSNILKKDFYTEDEARNEIVINILSKHINLKEKSILDIGCGAGGFLKQIRRFNMKKIIGIEPSQEHIDNLMKNSFSGVEYFQGTLKDFVEKNFQKFDIIVLNGVIKHFNFPVENLKYCNDLLKQDGLLYFNNGLEEPNFLINVKKRVSIVAQNYFTFKTYLSLFKKTNFEKIYFQSNNHQADFVLKKINNINISNIRINKFEYNLLILKYAINKYMPEFFFLLNNFLYRFIRKYFSANKNIRYLSFNILKK